MPEPFETLRLGHSLVFTTPYVVCREHEGKFLFADLDEWRAFFARTLPQTGIADAGEAYAHLLKYGLSPNYWNEYVFEAYVNHQSDMILLAGFPDLPATRPHSRVNQAKARQAP